jgi:glycosyltransferase involved in cell wall biosynthesis
MRVLHILNELKPSGAEVMLYAAAPYWREKRIKGDILTTGIIRGPFAARLQEAGYRIHHVPFSASYGFLERIYKILKEQNYDVLHIHTERANFWYALLGYLTGLRRIVRTVHNSFSFKGKLRIERLVQRWIMRCVVGVNCVSISESVEENELRTFRNRSHRIPNWFDDRKFRPPSLADKKNARATLAIPDDVVVLISVGGCSPVKNHSAIIEALARLPADAPALYLHMGPETEDHSERKLAESLRVCSRIRFLGVVLDIAPVLSASDVYVMPSLYEGFSVAAIEAMAAGLPAILSDVPGLSDFRQLCNDVHWVDTTPDSIARAMLQFIEMPESIRREMGLRLSRSVHNHFAIEKGAGAYAELYHGSRKMC